MKTILTASLDPQTQQLIRAAGQGEVRVTIVEADGRRIADVGPVEIASSTDLWDSYDPQSARKAWQASAGVLRGVDVDALLADLKAEREQDSPGRFAA